MSEEFRNSEFEEEYDAFLEGEQEEVKGRLLSERIDRLNPPRGFSINADQPVSEAIMLMNEKHIGALLVCENDKLAGIFTERDILTRCLGDDFDRSTPVSAVMTGKPETLGIHDGIAYALNKMHLGGYRHIPVAADDGSWHIVSVRDIARWVVSLFPGAVLNLPPEPGLRNPNAESGG